MLLPPPSSSLSFSLSCFLLLSVMTSSEAFSTPLSFRGAQSMQARTWAAGPNLRPLSPLHLGRQHKISAASVEVHPVQLGDVGGSGNGRVVTGWWGRSNVGGPEEEEVRFSLSKVSRFARAGMLSVGGDACLIASGHRSRSSRAVTDFFLIVNVVVFLLQLLTQGALLEAGAKITSMIVYERQYYRLLTPIFLHGSLSHILVNCFSLNAIGPQVERYFGTERTVITYLLAGIAGNVASFYFGPKLIPSVGASGAIFGLVGALGVFLARHQDIFGDRSRYMLNGIIQTCILNLIIGLAPGSNIDNWGHIGGAIGGAVVAYLIGPNLKVKRSLTGQVLVDEPLVSLPGSRQLMYGR
ncbi:hypothetical protein GUITHDRAFT_166710 [Guillardia theta CCMP2712]|uniref:Peptidase S54 rhomboid domain-containing protein n=1 Tax=Guillardia theta (strain CCMP2712) TaxID=905079 RepID=L1I841_GUITC|nr:hypothetical protein GUITHDRAFT_166710 [Guillardia theta CCMP2712]EKX32426.1 hypothetical protein GUITHDRAFT_166710 [Guillardia theta CCMP2712]|eukprot:XP_005819406.1 hypothetical protein GUITHDRAFT_166710 [Guillardia theta CCMP2712]